MKPRHTHLVVQADKKVRLPWPPIAIITALISYCGLFVLILADFYCFIFQNSYFRIYQIPLVERNKYVIFDRSKLTRLTFTQKINCVYCEYANGVTAYFKAVTNQMEIYSCAIKHSVGNLATNHQDGFYDYDEYK